MEVSNLGGARDIWGDTELRDTEAKAGGLATIVPLLGPLFGAAYR